jgi:hypothetical protein
MRNRAWRRRSACTVRLSNVDIDAKALALTFSALPVAARTFDDDACRNRFGERLVAKTRDGARRNTLLRC